MYYLGSFVCFRWSQELVKTMTITSVNIFSGQMKVLLVFYNGLFFFSFFFFFFFFFFFGFSCFTAAVLER